MATMFLLIEQEEDFAVHYFAKSNRYQFSMLKREVFYYIHHSPFAAFCISPKFSLLAPSTNLQTCKIEINSIPGFVRKILIFIDRSHLFFIHFCIQLYSCATRRSTLRRHPHICKERISILDSVLSLLFFGITNKLQTKNCDTLSVVGTTQRGKQIKAKFQRELLHLK